MFNQGLHRLIIDGVTVWEVHKKRKIFIANEQFIVPPDITEVNVCGSGGGGGGKAALLGGSSGNIVSNLPYYVVPGETIDIVIGAGGEIDIDGEDSSFGTMIIGGGTAANYSGDGDRRDTCGGVHYDGVADGTEMGGQAGVRGDGGYGGGGAGSNGAGGGSGGRGGNGIITISYYVEEQ